MAETADLDGTPKLGAVLSDLRRCLASQPLPRSLAALQWLIGETMGQLDGVRVLGNPSGDGSAELADLVSELRMELHDVDLESRLAAMLAVQLEEVDSIKEDGTC